MNCKKKKECIKRKYLYFSLKFLIFILFSVFLLFSCSEKRKYEESVNKILNLMKEDKYDLLVDDFLSQDVKNKSYELFLHLIAESPPHKLLPIILKKFDSNIEIDKKESLMVLFKWKLINHSFKFFGGPSIPYSDDYLKNRDVWLKKEDSYKVLPNAELYEKVIDKILEIVKKSELTNYDSVVLTLYYANTEKGMELYPKMINKCDDNKKSMLFNLLENSNNPERIQILKEITTNKNEKVSKRAKELLKKIE